MPANDRIRLRRNPPNVAVPQGYDDLYFNSAGELVHESADGTSETVGSGGGISGAQNHITFDTTPTAVPTTEGTVSWNEDDHTLDLQTEVANTKIQVGQENVIRVRNSTGSLLADGTAVYITGATGQRATVAKAIASNSTHVKSTIGLVTSDISNNGNGYVTTQGLVRGINTSAFAEGATLYLSDSVAGSITDTAPTTKDVVRIGWCVVSGNNGSILVSVQRMVSNVAVNTAIAEDPAASRLVMSAATKKRVCATRSEVLGSKYSNSTNQTETSIFHVTATDDVADMQVGFVNPTDGGDATIKVAVDIGGTIYKLYFNGSRTKTIAAGGIAFTDPLGFRVAKGTLLKVRTYTDAGSGNVIKPNLANYDSSGGGKSAGVDYADSGSISTGTAYIFGPSLVIGQCQNPCLLVIGDSVMDANASTGYPRRRYGDVPTYGWQCGLQANVLSIAISGDSLAARKNTTKYIRTQVYQYADVALVGLGINDFMSGSTDVQIRASLETLWEELVERGLRVWQTTITPRSTSTDSWATVENQTALNMPGRGTLNDYIRTIPSPLTGIVEIADVVESARNSGKWKAAYTADGLHPATGNSTQQLLFEAIPDAVLDF